MTLRSLLAATVLASTSALAVANDTTERRITDALIWVGESARVARSPMDDGDRRAIAAFERNASLQADGALDPAELQFLMRMAEMERRREGYEMWTDARTGVRIGLPREWLAPAIDTPDGTRWASPDGAILIETFATEGETIETLDAIERAGSDRRVSYNAGGADWFVLSGTEAGGTRVFYVRGTMRDGVTRGFRASYTRDLAWRLSRVVTAMSSDFQPFPGAATTDANIAGSLTPIDPSFAGLPASGPKPEARPARRFAGLDGEEPTFKDSIGIEPAPLDTTKPASPRTVAGLDRETLKAPEKAVEAVQPWDTGLQLGIGVQTQGASEDVANETKITQRSPTADETYVGVPAIFVGLPVALAAEKQAVASVPDWLSNLGVDPAETWNPTELASLQQPRQDPLVPDRVAINSKLPVDGLDPADALSPVDLANALGIELPVPAPDIPFSVATAVGGVDPMEEWEPTVLIAVLGVAADAAKSAELARSDGGIEDGSPSPSLIARIRSTIATSAETVREIADSGLVLPQNHPGIDRLPTASIRVSSAPLTLQNGRAVSAPVRREPSAGTEPTAMLSIIGMVTSEGDACPTLRSIDGTLYSLTDAPTTVEPGAMLRIKATEVETSECKAGTAVAVRGVEAVTR